MTIAKKRRKKTQTEKNRRRLVYTKVIRRRAVEKRTISDGRNREKISFDNDNDNNSRKKKKCIKLGNEVFFAPPNRVRYS